MRVLALILLALAGAPKIEWQRGPCLGGNQSATACKTCAHCAYGGKDHGRGANSATCKVCEKPGQPAPHAAE